MTSTSWRSFGDADIKVEGAEVGRDDICVKLDGGRELCITGNTILSVSNKIEMDRWNNHFNFYGSRADAPGERSCIAVLIGDGYPNGYIEMIKNLLRARIRT